MHAFICLRLYPACSERSCFNSFCHQLFRTLEGLISLATRLTPFRCPAIGAQVGQPRQHLDGLGGWTYWNCLYWTSLQGSELVIRRGETVKPEIWGTRCQPLWMQMRHSMITCNGRSEPPLKPTLVCITAFPWVCSFQFGCFPYSYSLICQPGL